ncbi:MAG: protease inhibitor I42 family protein [Verrucomicrobiales bacterium]
MKNPSVFGTAMILFLVPLPLTNSQAQGERMFNGAGESQAILPSSGGGSVPGSNSGSKKAFGKVKELTDQDDRATVNLPVGRTVQLTLPANSSTGYQWELGVSLQGKPVALLSKTYKSDPKPPGFTGGGGKTVLIFKANGSGETKVTLIYKSPSGKAGKSFTFTVKTP